MPLQLGASWWAEWRQRLGAWLAATSAGGALRNCFGALGLHLASRLEWALRQRLGGGGGAVGEGAGGALSKGRGGQTAASGRRSDPPGGSRCDWLESETWLEELSPLPEFPPFPEAFDFELPLPAIPRPALLPPQLRALLPARETPSAVASSRGPKGRGGGGSRGGHGVSSSHRWGALAVGMAGGVILGMGALLLCARRGARLTLRLPQ